MSIIMNYLKKIFFLFLIILLLNNFAYGEIITNKVKVAISQADTDNDVDVNLHDGSGNAIDSTAGALDSYITNTGTAGTPNSSVITIQGITLMTPIQVGDNGSALTVDGTITANAGTNLNTSALALDTSVDGIEGLLGTTNTNTGNCATSLAVIDDWDESDRAKVNPIVGQAGVQGGSGAVSNNTQRVVLATDVALPTGANAIGKLASNSGVDIGDVDVTSISAGTNNIGTVDVDQLIWIQTSSSDVDNSAVTVFNCDGANSSTRYITVTNAGTGDLFCKVGGAAAVADGSTANYSFRLALGESKWLPIGYKAATSTVNDVSCIRVAAQTNDNVITDEYGHGP
jgi:hypothetical protein